MEVVEVCSRTNEVHLVIRENEDYERPRETDEYSLAEVKKMMKKEAAKPLLLLRAEWLDKQSVPKNVYRHT